MSLTIELLIKWRETSFDSTIVKRFILITSYIFFTYLQWSKLQQQSQTMKNLQSGGVSLSHLQKFGNNEEILR